MITIGERLLHVNNRPSGFDYMRLMLAVGVIAMHSVIVCYGPVAENEFWQSLLARPIIREILPAFFALSGFLVAGSLERSRTLGMFLALRVIRIFPALSVEVFLSALIIGPIFTVLPLSVYFTHPMFWKYFQNIVGHVQFHLPGVFASNPLPEVVNGQMWTVPYELYCYLILAALALVRRRWAVPVAAALIVPMYMGYRHSVGGLLPEVPGPVPGTVLLVCFLIGVSFYLYRDVLPFSRLGGIGCLVVSAALLSVVPYGEYFAPLPIVYATVVIGLLNPRRTFVVDGADYSYGVFLYGYPIQQAFAATGPWAQVWYVNILATLSVVLILAALSWHFVEKPAAGLRPLLRRIEERYLARQNGSGK